MDCHGCVMMSDPVWTVIVVGILSGERAVTASVRMSHMVKYHCLSCWYEISMCDTCSYGVSGCHGGMRYQCVTDAVMVLLYAMVA